LLAEEGRLDEAADALARAGRVKRLVLMIEEVANELTEALGQSRALERPASDLTGEGGK
jgi:hypothetical protein